MEKKLFRSEDRIIAGVCGGCAEALGASAAVIRFIAVLLLVVSVGFAGAVYLAMWYFIPKREDASTMLDVVPESVRSDRYGEIGASERAGIPERPVPPRRLMGWGDVFRPRSPDDDLFGRDRRSLPTVARVGIAIGLLAMFAVVVSLGMPFFPGAEWWQFWPLLLIAFGVVLIILPLRDFANRSAMHLFGVSMVLLGGGLTPTTLGMLSLITWLNDIIVLWPVVIAAFCLFGLGYRRQSTPLMLAGVALHGVFVIAGVLFFAVPGSLECIDFSHIGGGVVAVNSDGSVWLF